MNKSNLFGQFCCVILLAVLVLPPFIGFSDEQHLLRFQEHFGKLKAFRASFKQEFYDALLEKTSRSQGIVYYKKPGLMRWSYQTPDEMLIVIAKEKIWIYDPDLENVTIQAIDQVSKMNSLSFLLKNKKLTLHFNVIQPKRSYLDQSDKIAPLYLSPKEPDSNLTELQVGLDNQRYHIKQFVIIDSQQNYRKISFSNLDFSIPLDISLFRFVVTEGMEVIDEVYH